MTVLTDTQRLEFIFLHQPVFDRDAKGRYMVFWYENRKCISRGSSFRDCIDNVTTGNFKYVDDGPEKPKKARTSS